MKRDYHSTNLCYLTGVLQGDGCRSKYFAKERNNRMVFRDSVSLEAKDLEMVKRSNEIFSKIFNRNNKIYKRSCGRYGFKYLVKTLTPSLESLDIKIKDPPIPPKWIDNDIRFFGPYLAGVIDSDGTVCIKRPAYPQCDIKIISGHPQIDLKKSIERHLNCKVFFTEKTEYNKIWKMWTTSFTIDFTISPKNVFVIKEYILPYLTIPRKKNKIEKYIKERWRGEAEIFVKFVPHVELSSAVLQTAAWPFCYFAISIVSFL